MSGNGMNIGIALKKWDICMYNGSSILGIIPARGGSKGLPRKNIRPLLGKPLIAWTIEQALSSEYIDRVIVSTEDEEIAEISKKFGAEVPFIRSRELASDNAEQIDVIIHAINRLEMNNDFHDLVILLQPTSPLRTSKDIDSSVELLSLKNAKAIVSVCEVEHHPYWTNILPSDGCMENFLRPEIINKNRQELPVFFRLNGAVYLAYSDYLKAQRKFFGKKTFAYLMPRERSVDIDTDIDFRLAEILMSKRVLSKQEFKDGLF